MPASSCACTPWLSTRFRALILIGFALLVAVSAFAEETSLDFLVLGDWGRDGEFHQRDVAGVMGAVADTMGIDFVISTGDNFYNSGVKSVNDPQWMSSFEMVYTSPSLMVPWYAALGNHDYRSNWQAQVDYTATSSRWKMPAPYYTFQYNLDESTSIQFFVLDTNPFPMGYNFCLKTWRLWFKGTDKQMKWFEDELAKSTATWKIVVGHHGLYSTGSRHGNTSAAKKAIEPLLNEYGVQAYFNGHDHNLQHQDPEESDVQYFTSGAGSRLQKLDDDKPETRFALSVQGFMAVRVEDKTLTVQVVNYEGKLLYSTTIGTDGRVLE